MQSLSVEILVGLALLYVIRQTTRTWFGNRSGCVSGCGKCATEMVKEEGRIELKLVEPKR